MADLQKFTHVGSIRTFTVIVLPVYECPLNSVVYKGSGFYVHSALC